MRTSPLTVLLGACTSVAEVEALLHVLTENARAASDFLMTDSATRLQATYTLVKMSLPLLLCEGVTTRVAKDSTAPDLCSLN
jgi:hypothetical protein